jgi:IS30 family transposase
MYGFKKKYSADYSQIEYERRNVTKGPSLKIGKNIELSKEITYLIRNKKYSIGAALAKIKFENRIEVNVCERTIYNYVRDGILDLEYKELPYGKETPRKNNKKLSRSLKNRDGVSIEERPKDVEERLSYGHWEMDTVVSGTGKGKSVLLVLTERYCKEERIIKIANRKQESVIKAIDELERKYGKKRFREKFLTITTDNGVEFLDHRGITKGNRTKMYFAHAYSSWERGSNEVANRLIRRFYKKGYNIDKISNRKVKELEDWINNYPRKILGWKSTNQFLKDKQIF